ncbi:ABC transporter permease [Geodermatophilus maliterrae]|uniref:ABC transporter permease n=1 Tax=Geodermatophilus maliterrae TaxID=3162531 RepID=A0ABV3XHY2_9ACTN
MTGLAHDRGTAGRRAGERVRGGVATVLTVAGLTLREAARRKVLRALGVLTVALLGLSAWGFAKLAAVDPEFGALTSGEARLVASQLLNLVMFGLSLIAALGTAFLAGPTLSGEVESGMALSVLARPVRRATVLLGKWLGLVVFGSGFVAVAGLAQFLVVQVTVGYWPPDPLTGLLLLAAQTTVLMTLALLLSTAVSPMASGIVAVGLFGATWVAGVVGSVGEVVGNDGVAQVGTVSRMLLPTDGLWRGAMHAFQDSTALSSFGADFEGSPFLGVAPLSAGYLAWVVVWIALIGVLAALSFTRRDV